MKDVSDDPFPVGLLDDDEFDEPNGDGSKFTFVDEAMDGDLDQRRKAEFFPRQTFDVSKVPPACAAWSFIHHAGSASTDYLSAHQAYVTHIIPRIRAAVDVVNKGAWAVLFMDGLIVQNQPYLMALLKANHIQPCVLPPHTFVKIHLLPLLSSFIGIFSAAFLCSQDSVLHAQ